MLSSFCQNTNALKQMSLDLLYLVNLSVPMSILLTSAKKGYSGRRNNTLNHLIEKINLPFWFCSYYTQSGQSCIYYDRGDCCTLGW